MTVTPAPRLSLILCSRNDDYMGNSRWRLETTLNYIGERVREHHLEADVDVTVADWGSEVPLSDVVQLRAPARRIVSFLHVPPALARARQGDSPFPEVLALNAAARRAPGTFIGRIDQDTLVGGRFLQWGVALAHGHQPSSVPSAPDATLWFANRRSIPYRLAARCPAFPVIERFVAWFGSSLRIETGKVFYNIDVGIWLLHRGLWDECGGYDERMIYMNDMEIDMATRLMSKYPMVNLGEIVAYDFYHLDHYHPGGSRSSSTHRVVNEQVPQVDGGFRPSGQHWGMASDVLALEPAAALDPGPVAASRLREVTTSGALAGYAWSRVGLDRLVYPFYPVWRRRATLAWAAVRGESLHRWPGVLRRLWQTRR